MSLVLASRKAALLVPWLRNPLWAAARAVPSLDLRFADSKSLIDAVSGQSLVTFTRASDATFVNSQGVLTTASSNVPRFDHNPTTGESLGLLIEEQRTNEVRNSNSMTAVVAGSPGTLPTNWSAQGNTGGWTREVVGSGSLGALNYVDVRFSGTPTGTSFAVAFQSQGVVAASNGQTWAPSVYHQLVGGSISNITGFPAANLWNAGSSFVGGLSLSGTIIPSSTLQRYASSGTINVATTAFISWGITFTCTAGNTYDFTIRFAGPQLEQGAFATSVIPTTGTAATRSADVADLISAAIANNIRSFYVEFSSPAVGTRGAVSLNDNTANERLAVITSGTDPRLVVHDGGVEQANIDGGTVTANDRTRVAVRIGTNDFAISVNGGAVVTDTSGTLPTVDRLMLGRTQAGEYLNGRLARFVGWSQLLPDSTLQTLGR